MGTPGRVEDFVKTNKLDLSRVRFYVLDEVGADVLDWLSETVTIVLRKVDGLLSQGNYKLLSDLYKRMPSETPDGRRLQVRDRAEVLGVSSTLVFRSCWLYGSILLLSRLQRVSSLFACTFLCLHAWSVLVRARM